MLGETGAGARKEDRCSKILDSARGWLKDEGATIHQLRIFKLPVPSGGDLDVPGLLTNLRMGEYL